MIVDSHLHVISPDRDAYPVDPPGLPGDHWFEDCPVSAPELLDLFDVAGVAAGVLVQPVGAYRYDNRYTCDAASSSDRFAAVAAVDMTSPDRSAAIREVAAAGARTLRLFDIPAASDPWMATPDFEPVVDLAIELGVGFLACVQPDGLPGVERLLDRLGHDHPVVLDHCGFVDLDDDGMQTLDALAARGDLHLKISTHVLDHVHDSAVTVAALARRFGADRLIWGSDFSQTHDRTYPALVAVGRASAANLSDADADAYLGGNAKRLWW